MFDAVCMTLCINGSLEPMFSNWELMISTHDTSCAVRVEGVKCHLSFNDLLSSYLIEVLDLNQKLIRLTKSCVVLLQTSVLTSKQSNRIILLEG